MHCLVHRIFIGKSLFRNPLVDRGRALSRKIYRPRRVVRVCTSLAADSCSSSTSMMFSSSSACLPRCLDRGYLDRACGRTTISSPSTPSEKGDYNLLCVAGEQAARRKTGTHQRVPSAYSNDARGLFFGMFYSSFNASLVSFGETNGVKSLRL